MIKQLFFLLYIICAFLINAQTSSDIIFEKEHSELPFELQIENSGIYSIASFDVVEDTVFFSTFSDRNIYKFNSGNFIGQKSSREKGGDFVGRLNVEEVQNLLPSKKEKIKYPNYLFKKTFFAQNKIFVDEGGKLENNAGEQILIIAESKSKLRLIFSLSTIRKNLEFTFPSNLACADLIGIDGEENIYLLIETYVTEIPMKVKRSVYTISLSGEILSRLELPDIKYLYTLKDLQIDAEGNLYHLFSDAEGVKIIKWHGLAAADGSEIKYSQEYNGNLHFNNLIPTNELTTETPVEPRELAVRTEALRIGEGYVLHQYFCQDENLAPENTTAPDGDIVRTPDWLIVGENARIPYKWGGFNTLSQFDAGLSNERYAGDINTQGVSSYAVGVDCSGFVSRCWQMSYHASTAYMPNITTQYSSWDELKPGDAIHKVGHVRLFVKKNLNGSLKIVESTSRGWGVSYWTYFSSDLTSYTPRYYNNMVSEYNPYQPELKSVLYDGSDSLQLSWECSGIGIIGYKVYGSFNGESWDKLNDEEECNSTTITLPVAEGNNFFRVSSVISNPQDQTESDWSNVLGAGKFSSAPNCLIVDGFEREDGSWRGAGHTFMIKYGRALNYININYESIRNSNLFNSGININNFDILIWILGDESTEDETFSTAEQSLVKDYLENGGDLFVSGSEIGWDLVYYGDDDDKYFFNNYLKADYISDDAGSDYVNGVSGSSLQNCEFNIGQTYDEDYPDEIQPKGGSELCIKYANSKGAGIEYTGTFGSSAFVGKLVYLGFPLESTANDSAFNQVITQAVGYFLNPVSIGENYNSIVTDYHLFQNYPNPFNPATIIRYQIPKQEFVTLKIFDTIGREVTVPVNKMMTPGNYEINFNSNHLSSGIYFYRLTAGEFTDVKKMILIR